LWLCQSADNSQFLAQSLKFVYALVEKGVKYLRPFKLVPLLAVIENDTRGTTGVHDRSKLLDPSKKIFSECSSRLYFQGNQLAAFSNYQVHFVAMGIPVKIDFRPQASVEP
jgi:hypothetical protein